MTCDQLIEASSTGAAAALRAVDCLSNQTAAAAFGRLFGAGSGSMTPALTILLTLYIAFFAISLLTGRSSLGISALTPRMLTLGMVLTFATSWVAYQGVVWNLAVGAPDSLAALLVGTSGSATQWFANRIDAVFAAVAEAAAASAEITGADQGAAAQGSFSPTNLTWLAALILLLSTVGVLVTARIALAVLLAVGPIFVVLALFGGSRGLFAGWLRGLVLAAFTPFFAVVGGALMIEMSVPVIHKLVDDGGAISGRAAMALFLIAVVHAALMSMMLKILATVVAAWQIFGLGAEKSRRSLALEASRPALPTPDNGTAVTIVNRSVAITSNVSEYQAAFKGRAPLTNSAGSRTYLAQVEPLHSAVQPMRARGVGSRFLSSYNQVRALPGREIFR